MRTVRLPRCAAFAALGLAFTAFSPVGPRAIAAQGVATAAVTGGAALPLGDFGDDIGEEAGLAEVGFALGADVAVPIGPVPGLDWASRLEGMTFGVDRGFVAELTAGLPDFEVDMGRYWGAVLFTGLGYGAQVNEGTSVRGVGQVGAGLFKAPGVTVSAMGETLELVPEWQPAKGVSLGVGLTLNDRFVVDARFVTLINTEIKGEVRSSGPTEEFSGDQNVSWLQLTAGVRVW